MTDAPIDETLPEVVKNFLRAGATLETIRLDAGGKWTHEGLDFENPRIIDLFSRSVNRTPGGTWVLEIGQFTYPIEVEDTGFFVERVEGVGRAAHRITVELSDLTSEPLDVTTLAYREPGRLYCDVKDGRFRARFKRAAYYDIAQQIAPCDEGFALVLGGELHSIELLPHSH